MFLSYFVRHFLISTNGDNKLPPLSKDLYSNWNFVDVQDLDNRQTGLISIIILTESSIQTWKWFWVLVWIRSLLDFIKYVLVRKTDFDKRYKVIINTYYVSLVCTFERPCQINHQHRTRHSQNRVLVPSSKVAYVQT